MEAKETNITPQAELPILEVEHLRVQFTSDSGTTTAVVDESFSIRPGETLALVGESGSGKSVLIPCGLWTSELPVGAGMFCADHSLWA